MFQLRALLEELRAAGAECMIATKGYVGPCRRILEGAGLLKYFSFCYGNTGDAYGSLDYDVIASAWSRPEVRLLGDAESSSWSTKAGLIARIMSERGLEPQEVVLIDDDPSEVASVHGLCRGVRVVSGQGLGPHEMEQLRHMAAPETPHMSFSFVPPPIDQRRRRSQSEPARLRSGPRAGYSQRPGMMTPPTASFVPPVAGSILSSMPDALAPVAGFLIGGDPKEHKKSPFHAAKSKFFCDDASKCCVFEREETAGYDSMFCCHQ